jgi:hypothetical protein
MDERRYLVGQSEGVVEAWSVERLQFEAKGWQREFRADLRSAIAALGNSTGFLAACYASPIYDPSCDIENVLFYNVGSGFSLTTQEGLRFERQFRAPPPPGHPLSSPALHYHRYEVARAESSFVDWREGTLVARSPDVSLPRLSPETKPAAVWWSMRQAAVDTYGQLDPSGWFALRLELTAPFGTASAAALIKVIVDGFVSSLHNHDGSFADELAQRISTQIGEPADQIAHLLRQRREAPLGTKTLVYRRASGVQWAPDDARCVACQLVIRREAAATMLRGELHAVEPEELD